MRKPDRAWDEGMIGLSRSRLLASLLYLVLRRLIELVSLRPARSSRSSRSSLPSYAARLLVRRFSRPIAFLAACQPAAATVALVRSRQRYDGGAPIEFAYPTP